MAKHRPHARVATVRNGGRKYACCVVGNRGAVWRWVDDDLVCVPDAKLGWSTEVHDADRPSTLH